jgi:hypothetical protein
MIAIDVTMTTEKYQNITPPDVLYYITESYKNVQVFFLDCIDKNVVLNAFEIIHTDTPNVVVTRYFATTVENAEIFQNAFADMSTEFSMKKMWNEQGFDISFEQHEVNFDQAYGVSDLITSDGMIWSLWDGSQ